MTGLYEIASQAAVEALQEELKLLRHEVHLEVYRFLLRLRMEQRLYYISREMAADVIWKELRDNDDLLDLTMRAAIGFYSRMSGHEQGDKYLPYCMLLAEAIGGITHRGRDAGLVTDSTFSEKIVSPTELGKLFGSEHWLTLLLTLERAVSRYLPKAMLQELQLGGGT
jgi:hypothetical protein